MFVRKWSSARTGIKLSGKTASVQRQTFKYIQKSLTTIAQDQSLAPWKKNTKKWEVAKDFCTALYYGCLLSFLLFCSPMANNIWFHMLSSYTVWILSVLTICCVHSRVAGNHFKSNSCFLSGNLLKKLETCQCCIYSVLLLTSCQRINLPHLKTYHYSWVTFNSKNQRSSKKLSLDQNTTRQWEWVRFTIPGDNTTLMGFRNCLCLTGLFGLSLVTLFMKLSLKKQKSK